MKAGNRHEAVGENRGEPNDKSASAFAVEIDDAFTKTDGELELSEKVEPEKTIDTAFRWQVVAQDI